MNINLLDILAYSRGHGSETEAKFINSYLIPLINELGYKPTMDGIGNVWVEVVKKEQAPFLFVAHIDTCHRQEGMLTPVVSGSIVKMSSVDVDKACLGADDGVGIYTNLKMLEAGIPGTYLFTRGEEKGGIGAGYITKSTPEKLKGFKLCVEVDRAGTDEVIYSQCYGDCASIEFSAELGGRLGMGHKPSPLGSYTDCSEFAEYIPECVNLSAGYENQHTVKETVNLAYVETLTKKLLAVDWGTLGIHREAGDYGEEEHYSPYDMPMEDSDMYDYVYRNPDAVANYLLELGITEYEIESEWKSRVVDDDQLCVGQW